MKTDEYYWTKDDLEKLEVANSMPEFLDMAFVILDRMPQPVVLVSGPISTGGRGSIAENLKAFAVAISEVKEKGNTVFNQLPFEDKFVELSKKSQLQYFRPILDDFFLPILKSGKISKIFFMPGWETSTGAKWEYEQAQKLGIEQALISETI